MTLIHYSNIIDFIIIGIGRKMYLFRCNLVIQMALTFSDCELLTMRRTGDVVTETLSVGSCVGTARYVCETAP